MQILYFSDDQSDIGDVSLLGGAIHRAVVNPLDDVMRVLAVHGAAHGLRRAQHLLHTGVRPRFRSRFLTFMVPENSLAMDLGLITLAAAIMSSIEMLPECWMFFTFFLSLGGSLSALMIRAAAEGTTEQVACLFWIFSCTVTFRPFQSWVALAMSSPIFLGERPRGPTLGARELVAPTSPPTARR